MIFIKNANQGSLHNETNKKIYFHSNIKEPLSKLGKNHIAEKLTVFSTQKSLEQLKGQSTSFD
jgi:hypothetical protein